MKLINYEKIKENIIKIKKNNNIILVLKNNAYGFGIEKIIAIALECNVSDFAVISIKEAIKIRKLAPESTILLLEYNDNFKMIKKYNLILSVSNYNQLKMVEKHNVLCDAVVDIGMNRFGFKNVDNILINSKYIRSIYIHFPYLSEELKEKSNNVTKLINNKKLIHYGGSIISDFRNITLRIGAKIYEDALSFYGKILEIKIINKGERIGYDGYYIAKKTHLYAILNVGYYNGLNRCFNGYVYYKNNTYKVLGRLCMNNTFIYADESMKINDYVEFLGKHINMKTFVKYNKACKYECFLSIK